MNGICYDRVEEKDSEHSSGRELKTYGRRIVRGKQAYDEDTYSQGVYSVFLPAQNSRRFIYGNHVDGSENRHSESGEYGICPERYDDDARSDFFN